MRRLIREHFTFFLGTALAGLTLRLLFVGYFPAMTDDSRIYADLATNWLQHGIYGLTQSGLAVKPVLPTDARLPGYPAFLAGMFWLFGAGNFRAVRLAQVLVDLGTCFLLADLARRMVSDRAARIAFILAALCPFLANYTAAVLTETLEVFFTALALDWAIVALDRMHNGEIGVLRLWAATGAAIAICIMLRPDGGILLAAVILYLCLVVFYPIVAAPKGVCLGTQPSLRDSNYSAGLYPALKRWAMFVGPSGAGFSSITKVESRGHPPDIGKVESREHSPDSGSRSLTGVLGAGIVVALFALAPLAPWTIRNFRTLHHFQPLAPRYANETDELVPRGFNRWVKTWMADYTSVEEIYWSVQGDKIDAQKLPSRAFDSVAQRDATLALIADYNVDEDITPELDARFEKLAGDRIRAHPVRYYLVLPFLRVADMWLRPRTEILPPDPRWWEFNDDPKYSFMAVGFGLLNLAYVAAALLALIRRPSGIRWVGLLVGFMLLRSAFLGTLENPESRYTLEGYPAVIALAAAGAGARLRPRRGGT